MLCPCSYATPVRSVHRGFTTGSSVRKTIRDERVSGVGKKSYRTYDNGVYEEIDLRDWHEFHFELFVCPTSVVSSAPPTMSRLEKGRPGKVRTRNCRTGDGGEDLEFRGSSGHRGESTPDAQGESPSWTL